MHKCPWTWLELGQRSSVILYLCFLAFAFFYSTHDMLCTRAQNSRVYTLTFSWLFSEASLVLLTCLYSNNRKKDTGKYFASPLNNTAEQKKGNCKVSHANIQNQKSYSKTFFSTTLSWSEMSTYTSIKCRNNFYRWIYLNKTSNQIT